MTVEGAGGGTPGTPSKRRSLKSTAKVAASLASTGSHGGLKKKLMKKKKSAEERKKQAELEAEEEEARRAEAAAQAQRDGEAAEIEAKLASLDAKLRAEEEARGFVTPSVSAGNLHTMAVTGGGKCYVWGVGDDGRLGTMSKGRCLRPMVLEKPFLQERERIKSVSAGAHHSLVVTEKGNLYSFGLGDHGRLGQGDTDSCSVPRRVEEGLTSMGEVVIGASAGTMHSAACCESGRVFSWGLGGDKDGRLGHDEAVNFASGAVSRPHPVSLPLELFQSGDGIVEVSCGGWHTACRSREGRVYAWGRGTDGAVGHGEYVNKRIPKQVDALKEFKVTSLSCGSYHTVCCTDEGHIYVWGKGANGALGMGPQVEMTHTPQRILGALKHEHVIQVSAGQLHTVALTKSGQLFTWGRGAGGRLGHKGGATDLWAPKAVEPLQWEKVVHCDAGVGHTAVITATNACYVFGEGGGGRLGNGMQSPALLPIKIEDLDMGPDNKLFDDDDDDDDDDGSTGE